MRKMKKILLATLMAAAAGCLAFTASILPKFHTAAVNADSITVADESAYSVLGGSVRITDATYGPGVKFHVAMTEAEFAKYGTLNDDGKTATLKDGYTTGTLLMPYSLTDGQELTVGGTGYKATLSDTNTSNIWYLKDGYMQTVVYLYNIPESDYGTEMAVRGYIKDSTGAITYTEQVNTISINMQAIAIGC